MSSKYILTDICETVIRWNHYVMDFGVILTGSVYCMFIPRFVVNFSREKVCQSRLIID